LKGEVEDNREDNGTDDAGEGSIDVDCNCGKEARGKGNDTNDDGSLCHGLSFNLEGKFHSLLEKSGRKSAKGLNKSFG
jgi:hypothetical protein